MSKDIFLWEQRAPRKKRGRPLLLSLILLLLLSVLVACASLPLETERQMLENRIENARLDRCATVVDCFEKFKLPSGYDKDKIYEVESLLHKRFYKDLEVAPLAREAADAFMALYYDKISYTDAEEYTDALVHCLVFATGDEYGIYRTKEEQEAYVSSMSGTIKGGIGITVRKDYENGIATVVRVIDNSPAKEAGLRRGDILHSVEGLSVGAETMDRAFAKMQGEVGTVVHFTVLREGEVLSFELVRANLSNVTVSYEMLEGNIAFITVTSFKNSTFEHFKDAVDRAEAEGAVGIIFDMRDNPGGYLHSVANALDYIAPKDTELYSYGTKGHTTSYFADTEHRLTVPCVVLCNGSTASAGELFTSALRDFNEMGVLKATVVGTEAATYGKGIMQNSYELSDGSYVTVTMAYYNPPLRVNYHGVGVIPDRVCEEAQIMAVAVEELLSFME